ncbi:MAG: hypothetical protein K6E76_07970 [Patescibacteria group bacterium]|nr:hypothetical protein [Patescibacteria group bacterium]
MKPWYKTFYQEHKYDKDTKIRLIGLYTYDSVNVFVDFKIDSYLGNDFNNSSAHIYTNDIYQALTH